LNVQRLEGEPNNNLSQAPNILGYVIFITYIFVMKYTVDKNYFEQIDTREKAYILGFIYGDGCITNKNYTTLAIGVKDRDILEFIKKALNYSGPVRRYDRNKGYIHSLRITNKKLATDLKKHGVVPNKSKVLKFPTGLKDKLILPFIFGLFDSDGYIYIPDEDCKWKQYRKLGFSGTKSVVRGVKNELEKHGFSKTSLKLEKCGTYTTHYVCKHVEMFNELYKESPYKLKRKFKKFKDNEIVYTRLKGQDKCT